MPIEIDSVYEGKVTGVMKFGAFIALPEGKSGLCHISELSNSYVADINEYIKVGDTVKVKVIAITPEGKINLSIKRADSPKDTVKDSVRDFQGRPSFRQKAKPAEVEPEKSGRQAPQVAAGPSDDKDFESRLKKFMQESDSRIADNPRYADRPRKNRRR